MSVQTSISLFLPSLYINLKSLNTQSDHVFFFEAENDQVRFTDFIDFSLDQWFFKIFLINTILENHKTVTIKYDCKRQLIVAIVKPSFMCHTVNKKSNMNAQP